MSAPPLPSDPHGAASQTWRALSARVEEWVAAWDQADAPPELDRCLPAEPAGLRRLCLVELIKVDLEYRQRRPEWRKPLERYALDFPELAGTRMPSDLIYEEYHVRRQAGEAVEATEYFERFPTQAAELRRLLGLEAPHLTTALFQTEKATQLNPGEQIDDFDLLARLGQGAFATVFLARQRSMQRLVALKVSADRGAEPQTMAQLDHPHIVRVYDQRQLRDRKLRLLYMQYIAGGTLQDVVEYVRQIPLEARSGATFLAAVDACLDRRGETPPAESPLRERLRRATWAEAVCWLGARLASALHYAHGQGVLHRDIKPANILLAGDATPKLVDFNISHSSKLDGATPAAYFGGSLAYMSTEQLEACHPALERQASDLDGRTDVFSLGVVLWELLTGYRPFIDRPLDGSWADNLSQLLATRAAGPDPQRVAQLPAQLPPGLDQVLLACLATDRDVRVGSGAELARQLELCLRPQVQRLVRPPQRGWRYWVRRQPMLMLLSAALALNAVASVVNIYYNWAAVVATLPPQARSIFRDRQIMTLNVITYSLGIGICILTAWPVLKAFARLRRGEPLPAEQLPRLRRRCLRLGEWIAYTVFALWAALGTVVAYGLREYLQPTHYLHLTLSHVLCGLIAATLEYFVLTFLCARALYPWLVRPGTESLLDLEELASMGRRIWIYFGLAVSVPFLSVLLLVYIDTPLQRVAALLGLVGFAGFALAFRLTLSIRHDLAALAQVASPAGEQLSASETWDSFWSSTRG
ncbi:MAG: serine/threonine protein kinase [Planctomycetaceae bacterium]|nr:serine/threonine protein kinase [Planctomycetaceae bacterium]